MPAARNAPATASMENFMVVVDVTMKSKRGYGVDGEGNNTCEAGSTMKIE